MKAVIEFEKLVMFDSIENFRNSFLVIYNENLRAKGYLPITDEQEIIDLFLDKLNEWKRRTK